MDAVVLEWFELQLLGEELLKLGGDEASFNAAVQRLLFSQTGRLALYLQREHDRAVGQAAEMAAVLTELATAGDGGRRVGELAKALRISTGSASKYLDRLGDLVQPTEDGAYRVEDRALRLWLAWRGPHGAVVPTSVLGDDAERATAGAFSVLGFELVYQSRASRSAFDLLAVRGASLLGVQVKRSALPIAFTLAAWARMEADAARFGWRWVVAAVDPGSSAVHFLDPARARRAATARLGEEAVIDNLLAWLEPPRP